jgi:HPt (histidine-containing phosphotransfer) domain-containing protein
VNMYSLRYHFINPHSLFALANGNAEFLDQIIKMYLNDAAGYIHALEKALLESDLEQVFFQAHKIKGVFSFIGADDLTEPAGCIEQMAFQKGSLADIKHHFQLMKVVAPNVLKELQDILTNSIRSVAN